MPLTPEEFHAHATAPGPLPLPPFVEWDIFPFEGSGMQVRPLAAPVPEQPRRGEDPATCPHCPQRDEGIWLDEHWRLERVPDMGVPLLTVHLARAVEALPHIARAHVTGSATAARTVAAAPAASYGGAATG